MSDMPHCFSDHWNPYRKRKYTSRIVRKRFKRWKIGKAEKFQHGQGVTIGDGRKGNIVGHYTFDGVDFYQIAWAVFENLNTTWYDRHIGKVDSPTKYYPHSSGWYPSRLIRRLKK